MSSTIADHAQRRQEAWEERRRCRLARAIEQASVAAGFECPEALKRFLVKLLEQLDLDGK